MLKVIGIVLGVIVLAVAAFAIYAATKPDSFSVKRTLAIAAPPR